jgi:hypothetical protein
VKHRPAIFIFIHWLFFIYTSFVSLPWATSRQLITAAEENVAATTASVFCFMIYFSLIIYFLDATVALAQPVYYYLPCTTINWERNSWSTFWRAVQMNVETISHENFKTYLRS